MSHIAIIGLGRVGAPLSAALLGSGYSVEILTRQNISAGDHHDLSAFDLAFLTVPDPELPSLAGGVKRPPALGLVHTSGQVRNASLGMQVSMFHPIMSIRDGESADIFTGCPIGISGTAESVTNLSAVAVKIGAQPFEIDEAQKENYHLAAMFASVFPYILLLTAGELAEKCGIPADQVADMLGPTFRQAVRQFAETSASGGLTGPVSRGDFNTVKQHMQTLNSRPELRKLYQQLTKLSIGYADQPPEISRKLTEALL